MARGVIIMTAFGRKLSKDLKKALNELAISNEVNWWKDVLEHPKLRLAIRNGYVDVYAAGQRIFKIGPALDGNHHPQVITNYKYLLRPRCDKSFYDVTF